MGFAIHVLAEKKWFVLEYLKHFYLEIFNQFHTHFRLYYQKVHVDNGYANYFPCKQKKKTNKA